MGSSTETVLELDDGTAAIPWEVLESPTATNRDKPWSICTKLLRKLRAVAPTITVTSTTAEDSILVIGDPACDRSAVSPSYGCEAGGSRCRGVLGGPNLSIARKPAAPGSACDILIGGSNCDDVEPGAIAVINAVMKEPWGIIHIAGHGEPPDQPLDSARSLVASSSQAVLFSAHEKLARLRVKPELVFVNCCHLATDDPNRLLKTTNYDRRAVCVRRGPLP